MWKRSAEFTSRAPQRALLVASCGGALAAVLLGTILLELTPRALGQQAPPGRLPPGPMQEKAGTACLSCHTAQIIVQQQLDRRVWAKEIDKMIRWGAQVAPEERDATIDYFAQNFGPREGVPADAALPPGAGAEKVRAACLGCHDAGIILQQQLDRRAWTRELDKMIRWGAPVPQADREAILTYLVTNFSPPAQTNQKKKTQGAAVAQHQREILLRGSSSRYNRPDF